MMHGISNIKKHLNFVRFLCI